MFRVLVIVAGSAWFAATQLFTAPASGHITVDPNNVGATDVRVGGAPLTNPVADPLDAPRLSVGHTANGELAVTDGGHITVGVGFIGLGHTASGIVTVDGPGSLVTAERLDIGRQGGAELHVKGGGQLIAGWPTMAASQSSVAVVTIDGPGSRFLPGSDATFRFGDGSVTLNIRNDGELYYAHNSLHWSQLDWLRLDANDTINLDGGVLDMHFGTIHMSGGQFRFTDGVLRHIRRFRGDLHQQGGRAAFFGPPLGHLETSIGAYTIEPAGTLEMHALATVKTWTAKISGTLDVYWPETIHPQLRDYDPIEINPEIGDTFTVLEATNGVVGQFNREYLPPIAGNRRVTWDVQYNPSDVTLEVVTSFLTADFDQNGVVDADDFYTWQTGFGDPYGYMYADADGDGDVDGDDFLIWQAQFGMTAGGGSGSMIAAVPEPATGVLALLLGTAAGVFGREP